MKKEQLKIVEMLTNEVIEQLKNGDIQAISRPGFKIKDNTYLSYPANYISGYPYSGINRLILKPGFYMTFNQIRQNGARLKENHKTYRAVKSWASTFVKVKKDEKTEIMLKDNFEKLKDKDDYEILDEWVSFKYAYDIVFHIEDIDNVPVIENRKYEVKYAKNDYSLAEPSSNRDMLSDLFFDKYVKRENIKVYTNDKGSFYDKQNDEINLKSINTFANANEFYEHVFHEASHSTGNEKRLKRASLLNVEKFSDDNYSTEEVTAELSAIYCLKQLGLLTKKQMQNCVGYLKSWVESPGFKEKLEKSPDILIKTTKNAIRAYEYIFKKE